MSLAGANEVGEVTLAPRTVSLTTRKGSSVRRTLPHRDLYMIGAWCFIDHYGPNDAQDSVSIGAHPHIGLQTASWLFSGEIEHRDSLGSIQFIEPGQLNLMTAGRGIAHSELSQHGASPIHGVQLWIALPQDARDTPPAFHHHADLPTLERDGLSINLFIGEMDGEKSPAKVFSDLVGAEFRTSTAISTTLSLRADYEYGILVDSGDVGINGSIVPAGHLHYIPAGTHELQIVTHSPSRALLLGGAPITEQIIMWWNFIATTHEEIESAREEWQSGSARFPAFADSINDRIPAPEMPNLTLRARGRQRG